MKVIDIGDEIWRELGQPSSLTAASISLWLRFNVGTLNNLLDTSYITNNQTMEISPELGENEKSIFKKLYICHWYEVQLRSTLGAASSDPVIEVDSDGAKVRVVNKNELSKTYIMARKSCIEELNMLVKNYRNSNFEPLDVYGNDTIDELGVDRG